MCSSKAFAIHYVVSLGDMTVITEPYLLVLNIALNRFDGVYWADPLWRKDLEAHLAQIADLAIACPVVEAKPPVTWEQVGALGIVVHPLPVMGRQSYLTLPFIAVKLWRAISTVRIVHTGIAGWPYPLGWIAIPIARFRRRFTILVVESAFWRIPPGIEVSPFARMRARLNEVINRALTRYCDVSFFTTQSYRDTLHAGPAETAHVLPAVWVDEDQLITTNQLARLAPTRGNAILFAGRLTEGKGVRILLNAVLRSRVPVDIVGNGELYDVVVRAQNEAPSLFRLLEPASYGTAFSSLLDRYAAIVVPTISDEQPRLIFDAFARGIPVLASATSGNRQIVEQAKTGLLYRPNDAEALAAVLTAAAADPARLRAMGETALQSMALRTHKAMHAVRAGAIAAALARHRRNR